MEHYLLGMIMILAGLLLFFGAYKWEMPETDMTRTKFSFFIVGVLLVGAGIWKFIG